MTATVLLVDDSKIVRTFIKVQLVKRKFNFLEASDGAEALAIARTAPVDLIIADINMPNMSGLGLLDALRDEEASEPSIPVILLTGGEVELYEEKARAAGAAALLQKPVNSAGLGETVNRLLPEP